MIVLYFGIVHTLVHVKRNSSAVIYFALMYVYVHCVSTVKGSIICMCSVLCLYSVSIVCFNRYSSILSIYYGAFAAVQYVQHPIFYSACAVSYLLLCMFMHVQHAHIE